MQIVVNVTVGQTSLFTQLIQRTNLFIYDHSSYQILQNLEWHKKESMHVSTLQPLIILSIFKYDKRKARSSKGSCSSHFAMLCESMAKFKIIYSTFISIVKDPLLTVLNVNANAQFLIQNATHFLSLM